MIQVWLSWGLPTSEEKKRLPVSAWFGCQHSHIKRSGSPSLDWACSRCRPLLLILTGQRHLSPSPLCTLYKMLSVGRLIWLSALCVLLLLLRLNMDARLLVHLICLWTLEPSLDLYLSRYKGFGAVTPWPIFVNSIRWVFGGCFWY